MTFQLVCIEPKELTQYKADMQEAFQKGFEDAFGKTDAVILPEKDIDQSLNAEGSAVYKAVVDGEMVGGAVVIINESTQHNHLDLLFVKNGVQSNGIGKKIWFELERIYPNTKVWETCTPYFDKRNIQMCSGSSILNLIMQFVYVACHGKQRALCKNICISFA